MSIATLDLTSTTTQINSLEAALSAAGILTTTHNKTSTVLIVTLTRSSRVFRFEAANVGRWFSAYGTGWTSGTTVTDSTTMNGIASGTGVSASLIVSADIVALLEHRGTTLSSAHIIGKLDDVSDTEFMLGMYASQNSPNFHRLDTRVRIDAAVYNRDIISTGNYYYKSAIPVVTNTGVLISLGIQGMQNLHRSPNNAVAYEVAGNDVIVPTGGVNGLTAYFGSGSSFYIANGSSWTP